MVVLPALVALPPVRVKLTALAERLSVSDSLRLAFRAIVCAPELSACADAIEAANVIATTTIAIRMSLPVFIYSPPRFVFPLPSSCCPRRPSQRIGIHDLRGLFVESLARQTVPR